MRKILLSLMAVFMAVPAFAIEFTSGEFKANIYGNAYVDAFYGYKNDGDKGSHSLSSQSLVGSSNLGITLSYGNISGTFEAGLGDPVRKYFMTYNIGGQEDHFLVLGRDTTIAAYSFGAVTYDFGSLNDFGTLADKRRLQIRYGIKGFELAVVLPNLGYSNGTDTGYQLGVTDSVTVMVPDPDKPGQMKEETHEINQVQQFQMLPRVELAYTYASEALEFKVFGAYGAYLFQDKFDDAGMPANMNVKSSDDLVLHSYNIGFGGQANFGASFLQFTGWYGNNLDLMDAVGTVSHTLVVKNDLQKQKLTRTITVDNENVQSAGVAIGIGHTFAEKYTPAIGVGYTLNFGDGYDHIDDSLGAYLNCAIQINDWFSITPEVAYYDLMQDKAGNKEGYEVLAGAVATLSF